MEANQNGNGHGSKASKKRKRPSPFRIKTGVIVALRYRPQGNRLVRIGSGHAAPPPASSFTQVWADPQPGRDEGTALIGRLMRGAFPKSILEPKDGQPSLATTRVIEGEIISLLDHEEQWETRRQQHRLREPTGTLVELLIDKNVLGEIPMLRRIDCNVDKTTMNAVELKRHGYEEQIRGRNKVVVKVCLSDTGRIATKGPVSTDELMVAQWKIKKRIPVGTVELTQETNNANNGESTKSQKVSQTQTQFVGDWKDAPQMQERNWRWMASRITDLGNLERSEDEGFLGEVLSVEPQPDGGETLAFVTLRRLILPEQLRSGRRPHHGMNDIYDLDGDAVGPFRVPVEELVIVHRKFERARQEPIKCKSSGIPVIQYKYLQIDNVLKPLFPEAGDENNSTNNICHRCQINQLSNGKQLCADCSKVIRPYRKMHATTLSDVCDCKDCTRKIAVRMDQMLKTNVRMAQDILDGEEIRNAEGDRETAAICCVCCLSCTTGVQCDMCPVVMHQHCFMWGGLVDGKDPEETLCRSCSFEVHVDDINGKAAFAKATSLAKAMCPIDFDLPANFLDPDVLPVPSSKAITSAKTKSKVRTLTPNGKRRGRPPKSAKSENGEVKTPSTTTNGKKRGRPPKLSKSDKIAPDSQPSGPSKNLEIPEDEYEQFRPTCSRTHQYDPIMRRFSGIPKHQSSSVVYGKPDTRRNHRKEGEDEDDGAKRATGRAARASQRRVMKDIAKFGSSSMELDALAGRESQLRFDRSGIHAWGVFADADINAGEMVVEYRGVLIGNAMAEKLENEYEKAKIGSDYMFRIDGFIVCDATKHGNVARFINASCDPNCYTKIITIDGTKRIVIYAKKDINTGEELSYDYKFPLEYNEEKRIPCHCGMKECRGFMNWDKRYVVIPTNTHEVTDSLGSAPKKHASVS
jgi:[histone H3]-lysine4 N-trimethyltransferase SETD1